MHQLNSCYNPWGGVAVSKIIFMENFAWFYKSPRKNYYKYNLSLSRITIAEIVLKLNKYDKCSLSLGDSLCMEAKKSWVPVAILKIKIVKTSFQTIILCQDKILLLQLSESDYENFVNTLYEYSQGKNDFCLEINGEDIWFW